MTQPSLIGHCHSAPLQPCNSATLDPTYVPTETKLARREAISGYLYIMPWILGFLLFTAIPIIASIYLAFTSYRGYGDINWIGFANFTKMFTGDDIFWQSVKVTLIYVVGFLPPGLLLGFGIALLMNRDVRGITFFRTIYYLPLS